VHTGDGVVDGVDVVLVVIADVLEGVSPTDSEAVGDTVTGEPVGVLDGVLLVEGVPVGGAVDDGVDAGVTEAEGGGRYVTVKLNAPTAVP